MDPNTPYQNLNEPSSTEQSPDGPNPSNAVPRVPGGFSSQQQPVLDPSQWFRPEVPGNMSIPSAAPLQQPLPPAQSYQGAYQEQAPPKRHHKLLIILCVFVLAVIAIAVPSLLLTSKKNPATTSSNANTSSDLSKTADAFVSAVYINDDYATYQKMVPDSKLTQEEFQKANDNFKNLFTGPPNRAGETTLGSDSLASATYSFTLKQDNQTVYMTLVLTKQDGTWTIKEVQSSPGSLLKGAFDPIVYSSSFINANSNPAGSNNTPATPGN